MNKNSFHSTACALCGSSKKEEYDVIFPANYKLEDVESLFSARRLPDQIHSQIVRCKNDGQVRSNPVLNSSVLNALYKESEFNYQHEVKNLVTTYIKAISHVLSQVKKTDPILEIGCGSGFVLTKLKKMGYAKIFGVEPSKLAVDASDKLIRKHLVQKPFSAHLFPKKTFKLIFFSRNIKI